MRQRDESKRFTKVEKSWIFYDWANSVYATNIMAVIFPIYYASVAGDLGNKWWGIGVSLASLIGAFLAPTLGALADFKGNKKKLLFAFILIGALSTAALAFVGDWKWMLIGYVISHIGFSGSCVFYDSFLTDVTTQDRMDRVSSWGYAMGYIGGSTIPFVISIAVMLLRNYDPVAMKFAILIVTVWWLVFSIPILKNVKQVHYVETPQGELAKHAFRNLVDTMKRCVSNRGLLIYLLAYFLYIDGVGAVISLATNYGATLGLGTTGMIFALLVTQLVAAPCAILFSKLSGKFGAIRMIISAIAVYFVICGVGFFMGRLVEPYQLDLVDTARSSIAAESVVYETKEDQKAWEALQRDFVEETRAALSAEDRAAAFEAAVADSMRKAGDPAGVSYAFSGAAARTTAVAAIESVGDELSVYARDAQKQANYNSAKQTATTLFWVLAVLVGTVQGGIQALSRSYYGKLVPRSRSAEYFGFYDVFGKFATVIGPLLYAMFYFLTDRASVGILSLLLLFAGGGLLLLFGRKELVKTELEMREANARLEAEQ
ncbi:MAG: MFS transporter [Eubacteriales bacterium]|jgi:UMF1 family MFS transporter|nr:MFS transporter [Eubacteriales bacterium]